MLDAHPAAIVTGSVQVKGSVAYVGVSSLEEVLAAFVPGLPLLLIPGAASWQWT